MTASFLDRIELGIGAKRVRRNGDRVGVWDAAGRVQWFDHVVIAAHADEALAMLDDPSAAETRAARRIPLQQKHRDPSQRRVADAEAPRGVVELELHRTALARESANGCTVTYWMNRLQNIAHGYAAFCDAQSAAHA